MSHDSKQPVTSREIRAMLLNVLWHHQGGSSLIGQPIRAMLGIGEHAHLNAEEVAEARRIEALLTKPSPSGPATIAITLPAPANRSDGWQSIETAPKDGTMILAWPSSTGKVCYTGWVERCCQEYPGGYWDTLPAPGGFTLWCRVTAPPESVTTERAA